jgi:RNA recognition motif-containing protein
MKDKVTGQSRGFGFVTYKDSASADNVVNAHLELDGRKVSIFEVDESFQLR